MRYCRPMETQPAAETDLQPPVTTAPATAPPGLSPDALAQLLDDWAATIPVDECTLIDGRLQRMTLAQLDRVNPARGGYWRGVYMERYRLGGSLPLRLPDVSAAGAGLGGDEPGQEPQQGTADQGDDPAPGT